MFETVTHLQTTLAAQHYVCDHALATALFLALKLGRPLFLEGEAGVGKTEVAKVLAAVLDRELIRLQCYEGLDIHTAVYEWDYARQILQIRLMEAAGQLQVETAQQALFSPSLSAQASTAKSTGKQRTRRTGPADRRVGPCRRGV